MQPMQMREAQHGVSFQTDLSAIGTGRSQSRLFGGAGASTNVIDEERRLIEKVFSIVDKDNSGSVDIEELKGMFRLFGVEVRYLDNAISRIMSNVDKDFDGMINPTEFYQLLSQKFEKGDSKADIRAVFDRMDKDKNGELDIGELHQVSQDLGESITKEEVKGMVKMFSQKYQDLHRDWVKNGKQGKEPDVHTLTFQDFYAVMQEEL
mmetsp:Transcript_108613/g.304178  ORF Transcript_108613/g.304178 Transcript_108613/m.304178 type:complete len:207 (+) Transcript_108613:91-711(+)